MEDHCSPTNPFSSGFFEARFAVAKDEPTKAITSNHDDEVYQAEVAAHEPPGAPVVAIQDLSLNEIPVGAENARLVISPRGPAPSPSDNSEAVVPFGQGPGELLAVLQSSKSAWFSLTLAADLQFTFYYDPASDNLVLRNSSYQPLKIGPIEDETSDTDLRTLEYCDVHLVSPGPWRIYPADYQPLTVLVDFLVLRRRYILETQTGGTQAGAKRKEMLSIEAPAKRYRTDAGSIDQSIVLISKPPNTSQMELVGAGNPLINLQPGQTVFVTAPGGVPSAENLQEHSK
ncbi:hypothetical protein QQX98_000550 [Neonectria punicea]|uniref:Uncharacterized protein n=1 Tax=Neonectria punicea TaxID=979145 RepID=A0ABR1HTI7_9HYPO